MPVIASPTIRFASYEERIGRLRLVLQSGAIHAYDGLTRQDYEELLHAHSASDYLERSIRPRFKFTDLTWP